MRSISKFAGIGTLTMAVVAGAVAVCIVLDGGRVLDAVTGRTSLEAMCLPELRKELAGRGFSPTDIELVPRGAAPSALWRPRSYAADFTFQDGPGATRVDGIMACILDASEVRVDVRTRGQPIRAS